MLVDGERLQLLQESSYFAALLSGRWTSTKEDAIPVLQMPCSRIVCKEIFSILVTEDLTYETEPTVGLLSKIDQTIDMLGLNYSKNPILYRSSFWADLYSISTSWYRVHREELSLTLGTSAEMSDFSLVEIDDGKWQLDSFDRLLVLRYDCFCFHQCFNQCFVTIYFIISFS